MDSFYGGKPGTSFIIKDTFDSVEEMDYTFENGFHPVSINGDSNSWMPNSAKPNITWYGEYVLIDTVNKNNIDNGKIFKRTASKGETEGSTSFSEYIGQIVGPAGGTPNIVFGSIKEIEDKFDNYTVSPNEAIWFINKNGEEKSQKDGSDLKVFESTVTSNIQIKSGKEYFKQEPPTTPALKYNWYNLRTADASEDDFAPAKLYMGLEIPYVDYDITVTPVNYTQSATITPENLNAFYKKYTINIPNGIPGAYITNIQQATVSGDKATISGSDTPANVYELNDDVFFKGKYKKPESSKTTFDNFTKIWVGQVAWPDNNNGEPKLTIADELYYLGDVYELTGSATISSDLNSNFGLMSLQTTNTPVTVKLPLISKLTLEQNSDDGYKHLRAELATGGSLDAGKAYPDYWGVWATKLTDTPNTAANSVDKPKKEEGNLGYYDDYGNTYFYAWEQDSDLDVTPVTGHWRKLEGFGGETVYFKMPDGFNLQENTPSLAVTFIATNESMGSTPTAATVSSTDVLPWIDSTTAPTS